MHKLLLVSLVACGSTPSAPPASKPAPAAPVAKLHDATVDAVVGVWLGKAEDTPFGDFPMALAFQPDPDGSIHARLDDGKGMYIDFRFTRRDGAWYLHEEGAIPGAGKQSHTLAPVANAARWANDEVDIAFAVTPSTLVMTTSLGGKPHATFRLERKSGPEAEQIRQQLANSVSPSE